MMLALCTVFPLISRDIILPYLVNVFGYASEVISENNIVVMIFMLVAVFVIPVATGIVIKKSPPHHAHVYMNGYNEGDDLNFKNSFGGDKRMYLTNWYMEDWFGEKKLYIPSAAIATAIVVICLAYSLGGAL